VDSFFDGDSFEAEEDAVDEDALVESDEELVSDDEDEEDDDDFDPEPLRLSFL
jgi:hypothetical protein